MLVGDVGVSTVVRCWGDGIVTVLALAGWCQRRRDPTINMNGRGKREVEREQY
jgi:hypothetical protein